LCVILLAVGLLIGVVYLTLIAERVRGGERATTPALLRRIVRHWLQLLLFVALLAFVFFAASIPFLLVTIIASAIVPPLGALIMVGGITLSYWVLLYLFFVSYALVLDDVGLLRAIWYSANIVQRNFLPTFGLIVLSYIIAQGMLVVWQLFEVNWWG